MSSPDFFDLDDAADEADVQPSRRGTAVVDPEVIASAPARRRLSGPTPAALESNHDFVIMRKQAQPVTRFSLKHADLFQVLWKLWAEKRVAGADDPGVTLGEIHARLAETGKPIPETTVGAIVRSLTRYNMVTTISQFVGVGATRSRFYPTEMGVQAFALATHLGYGAFVQVGRSTKSWRSRSAAAPSNLFQHAALLAQVKLMPVESA